MRIAVPTFDGKLCMHFGHCDAFVMFDVHPETREIQKRELIQAPPHQPGLLPSWLASHGAQVIIAAGIGQRAQSLLNQKGIQVVVGASAENPEDLVTDYLKGELQVGDNVCDH